MSTGLLIRRSRVRVPAGPQENSGESGDSCEFTGSRWSARVPGVPYRYGTLPGSRGPAPSHRLIVEANRKFFLYLGLDFATAERICWACRIPFANSRPVRAHVNARVWGGSNQPSNFFLLCNHCHAIQPDGAPESIQRPWVRSAARWCEWSFFAMGEILYEVARLAGAFGIPPERVDLWRRCEELPHLLESLEAGYAANAGLNNGRGNAIASLAALVEEWSGLQGTPSPQPFPHVGGASMMVAIAQWESGSDLGPNASQLIREAGAYLEQLGADAAPPQASQFAAEGGAR